MIPIHEHYSLKNLNTFGVAASCRWFVEINEEGDLQELFSDPQWLSVPRLVLGGGSNILFTQDFDGLLIKINIPGINYVENGDDLFVTAGAGVIWNDFVNYCVDHGFAGVENLSLIPGSVGASPIQNIGAYGVEIKDVLHSCEAFEIKTRETRHFTNEDCQFGYRDSIFKSRVKGQYIITAVTYRLSRRSAINTSYGAIAQELGNRGIAHPTISDISNIVSAIRVSKLPDPSTIGNAGSFFKNPVIEVDKFRQLQSAFPDIVHFSVSDGMEKLSAGWLIEKIGWKGVKINETGTWKNQALVLVNYGNASGIDVYNLSAAIIQDVEKHFGITLEREVNVF
ncbi:UDP-N-acetylmuramate dehydrogenase [Hufsiella ginkgonis]|uniref:UDP-N-acetylenolpyruvoylglucosamine reductase n=1 Tax=Hufsiella ginkgonis TaxID=2695274 RepID=A0A7K1XZT6_9SPHI|nr:UDP-N-acetylmuramate dehydrogenase [Hufsiella ginkgonis]MXV16046.1 UDP-N-acetylmuramate dehydrogenase [Hufsiella ginkgonis]